MMSTFLRCFGPWAGATLLLLAISAPGLAQEKKYKPLVVRTPDGVTIAAQEWGNPSGSEILFIHGFSQASLSWQRQVESDLAKEFRMVTYALRGHGNSDKPLECRRVGTPQRDLGKLHPTFRGCFIFCQIIAGRE